MNAKTDGWESYTDHTGRRHWRWPAAADRQMAAGSTRAENPRQKIGHVRKAAGAAHAGAAPGQVASRTCAPGNQPAPGTVT